MDNNVIKSDKATKKIIATGGLLGANNFSNAVGLDTTVGLKR